MGSAAHLESNNLPDQTGTKKKSKKSEKNDESSRNVKGKKRSTENQAESTEVSVSSRGRKMLRRAAACTDFKEKSVRFSEKSDLIQCSDDRIVEEEILALRLTCPENSQIDEPRPNRRLSDFIIHDEHGVSGPLEMLELDDMFITGLVLPLDESDKDRSGVRCQGFGRIETWDISGYDDGIPVVWLSTEAADYHCVKAAASDKKFYDHFFEKANACIQVYKQVSKCFGIGGEKMDSSLCLDELLAGVVRANAASKCFAGGASVKDFVVSQGEFIYNQLIGLDKTSKRSDQMFVNLPVLVALRDQCRKRQEGQMIYSSSSVGGVLKIGDLDTVGNHNWKEIKVADFMRLVDQILLLEITTGKKSKWLILWD